MSPRSHRAPSRTVYAAGALVLLLALTACSADASASGQDSEASADLLPAAEGKTQYPLTLESWGGEVVIEERPQRVAALGYGSNIDPLLALGVTPVYVFDETLNTGWFETDWTDGIEVRDEDPSPTNIEAIASSNPDLIVAYGALADTQELEKLAAIAPVLEISDREVFLKDWKVAQRAIGEVLDLQTAAETAIADVDDSLAAAAAEHPEFAGKTVSIAQDYGDGTMVFRNVADGPTEHLLGALGIAPHPNGEQFVADAVVSNELLSLLDADALIVFYFTDEDRIKREAEPVFQAVPAVAEGRYLAIVGDDDPKSAQSGAQWTLHIGQSAVSIPWALGTIVDWLDQGFAA